MVAEETVMNIDTLKGISKVFILIPGLSFVEKQEP